MLFGCPPNRAVKRQRNLYTAIMFMLWTDLQVSWQVPSTQVLGDHYCVMPSQGPLCAAVWTFNRLLFTAECPFWVCLQSLQHHKLMLIIINNTYPKPKIILLVFGSWQVRDRRWWDVLTFNFAFLNHLQSRWSRCVLFLKLLSHLSTFTYESSFSIEVGYTCPPRGCLERLTLVPTLNTQVLRMNNSAFTLLLWSSKEEKWILDFWKYSAPTLKSSPRP